MGQALRFVQEFFLVACSLADLVRRFRRSNADWSNFSDEVAIQLNDTHPAIAVPELMRILLDDAGLGWDEAWELTRCSLAYTNHTLLPEALEKWPLAWVISKMISRWRGNSISNLASRRARSMPTGSPDRSIRREDRVSTPIRYCSTLMGSASPGPRGAAGRPRVVRGTMALRR